MLYMVFCGQSVLILYAVLLYFVFSLGVYNR